MRLIVSIFTLVFCCLAVDARAQISQELGSVPEAWELTLDVIKNKAQILLIENNGKQVEYRKLIDESQKLQQAIDAQQAKNQQMAELIKERHGRTDQQIRIEELTDTVRAKRIQAKISDAQFAGLQIKKSDLDNKIQRLKYTISDLELHATSNQPQAPAAQEPAPGADDELAQLRKQMEEAAGQEVLLENQLNDLKNGGQAQHLSVDAVNEENKQLEARLQMMRLQKLNHDRQSSDAQLSQANARLYDHLKRRKDQLESDIYAYESSIDQLRRTSLLAMSWPLKKRQLVHTMVQVDARNNQMRAQIKVLREDIDVLKDQVARLERRLNFAQGKDSKQQGDFYVQN